MHIIRIDETDSTNRWLRDYRPTGNERMTAVVADYQTAGRGCGANHWESERGKNLLLSLLIHPKDVGIRVEEQFLISELVSLTIADTVKTLVPDPEKLSIKWPNDIYYGDRKLAGILIENRVSGGEWRDCIVGIGLNVNQEKFVSEAPNPISLRQITQTEISREYVTETFLNLFETIWTAPPEYAAAHAQYRRQLYRRTGIHPYRDAEGLFEAELLDVTTHGQLLLYDIGKRERRTYAFKEVGFIMGESS